MNEADEVMRLASEFLRTVRDISMTQNSEVVSLHQVADHMGTQALGVTGSDYVTRLSNVGQYLARRGLLEAVDGSKMQGPSNFKITREGINEVEGRNQPQEPSVTFNMEGSTFNQSPVGMNNTNSFTGGLNFANVEQRIQSEAREEDKEELRKLVAEVKDLLDNGQTANKGFLARWNDKLQKYDWLRSAVAGWVLNFVTQV